MLDPVLMSSLSWIEYQQKIQASETVVFIPCGATEQHGPHLPLGTDALLSTAIAQTVAAKVNGIVAPTLSYGYKSQPRSGGGQHFPGTTSLDGNNLIQLTQDLVCEFARQGVNSIVMFNGHYENQWFLTEGIDLARRDLGSQSSVRVMRLEYWDFFTTVILEKVFPDGFPGFALEHAAVIETSLMLHYYPEMVRLDLLPDVKPAEFPPYDMFPYDSHTVPATGVLSSAKAASAEKGAMMAAQVTNSIASAVRQEFHRAVC